MGWCCQDVPEKKRVTAKSWINLSHDTVQFWALGNAVIDLVVPQKQEVHFVTI
jgi:hypothetical protein